MVDLSPVILMAAPSDPLSHQLQRQHQHNTHNSANSNANPNSNTNPWGTWEELLLGSAVLKHGADNWVLVSQELQSRAPRASFSFTPEACRAGYHAIRLRFGADASRDGCPNRWYEELRRLRVAHLRRELEQYESSIGSLESKIKRLQSESDETAMAKSPNAEPRASEENEVPCKPTPVGAADESVACGYKKLCSNMTMKSEEAHVEGSIVEGENGSVGPSHATTYDAPRVLVQRTGNMAPEVPVRVMMSLTDADMGPLAGLKQSNGVEEVVHGEGREPCDSDKEHVVDGKGPSSHAKQEQQLLSSSSTLYLSLSKSEATSSKSTAMEQENPGRDLISSPDVKQGVGHESTSAVICMKSHVAVDSNHVVTCTTREGNIHTSPIDRQSDDRVVPVSEGYARLALQRSVPHKADDTLPSDVSAKQGTVPSLKSGNLEKHRNLMSPYAHDVDDGGENSDESQSLCSPRLKFQQVKRRRSSDGGSGHGFSREICSQDDIDDKRRVRKALGEKSFAETVCNLPVESADSTEGKGRRALALKALSPDALAVRVKKEMQTCKEEIETLPGSNIARDDKDPSRKLVIVQSMNAEQKIQSTSSTENSLLHEVWGESVEVVNKEMKPACKRRRLMGRPAGKKRKATGIEDARRAVMNDVAQVSSMKTESISLSQEASESMQSPGGKEVHEADRWHQAERLSGDSRYEKSEVGSYGDGNEDISPMSRRNRREPKVSGKLIPLLESLRTICAHRCGHFFRHNQEPEENDMYYRIIRSPIDLGMIRTKLEEGHYSGSMHFFRDLLLMVSNALVYYPRDTSESAAASGLRECVIKEMAHVFETEALVKQEGPSFRKRDSRQLPGHGRRKGGLKMLATMDRASRERDRSLKHSDASTSMESRRMSNPGFASRLCEGGRADKGIEMKRNVSTGMDVRKNVESFESRKLVAPSEISSGLKIGLASLDKASEVKEHPRLSFMSGKAHESKEPGSCRSPMHLSRDVKFKDRSFVADNAVEKKPGSANVGLTSKASVFLSHKGKEITNSKAKAVPTEQQQPVKRGVGRPPKHSQQQGLLKAREVFEATNPTRKRGRK